jgi:hypothetical protein
MIPKSVMSGLEHFLPTLAADDSEVSYQTSKKIFEGNALGRKVHVMDFLPQIPSSGPDMQVGLSYAAWTLGMPVV